MISLLVAHSAIVLIITQQALLYGPLPAHIGPEWSSIVMFATMPYLYIHCLKGSEYHTCWQCITYYRSYLTPFPHIGLFLLLHIFIKSRRSTSLDFESDHQRFWQVSVVEHLQSLVNMIPAVVTDKLMAMPNLRIIDPNVMRRKYQVAKFIGMIFRCYSPSTVIMDNKKYPQRPGTGELIQWHLMHNLALLAIDWGRV